MSKDSAPAADTDVTSTGTGSTATLVDGATVQLRRLGPGDYDAVIELVETLTDRERYMRFFTMHPAFLDEWARSLTTPNADQYVLGVFEDDSLIATANYVMTSQPGYAEVAVLVAHLQHERGVGTALLRTLRLAAHRNGIHHLVADVLAANHPLHKVVVDAGWPCSWHRHGTAFRIDLDLDAASSSASLTADRDKQIPKR